MTYSVCHCQSGIACEAPPPVTRECTAVICLWYQLTWPFLHAAGKAHSCAWAWEARGSSRYRLVTLMWGPYLAALRRRFSARTYWDYIMSTTSAQARVEIERTVDTTLHGASRLRNMPARQRCGMASRMKMNELQHCFHVCYIYIYVLIRQAHERRGSVDIYVYIYIHIYIFIKIISHDGRSMRYKRIPVGGAGQQTWKKVHRVHILAYMWAIASHRRVGYTSAAGHRSRSKCSQNESRALYSRVGV